jgi:deazaflavin-dependent oxidoreductase (nitroreductase family)
LDWGALERWLYRGGRPGALARLLNRGFAALHASGRAPQHWVTLEVVGRRSGRPISFPIVMATHDGERYLVSMLGRDAAWVRNVTAAGGRAVLLHGRAEPVRLEEIAAEKRAPVLKAYLHVAPGARPHIPVGKDAPLAAFEAIADQYPVFRVLAAGSAPTSPRSAH